MQSKKQRLVGPIQVLHSLSHKIFKHYLKFACENHVQELCGSCAVFHAGVVRVSSGQSEQDNCTGPVRVPCSLLSVFFIFSRMQSK